ncbi:hypothetical protein DPMN_178751 [Dreissena polymorpha]|uniref:Uncharacterized protein n=1 Tax=Dreissena polymorpha TaxID=45954 RepID=A0A9D4EEV7_DREPO|nr:hypothetical protein DPMN_178751 [Dreissena polymorpha]
MVIPSGICAHPVGSTSCSMVPSHERRKPGTNSAWGRGTRCHWHYNTFNMSGWASGLRRCVQVAVWISRRGFKSHF